MKRGRKEKKTMKEEMKGKGRKVIKTVGREIRQEEKKKKKKQDEKKNEKIKAFNWVRTRDF